MLFLAVGAAVVVFAAFKFSIEAVKLAFLLVRLLLLMVRLVVAVLVAIWQTIRLVIVWSRPQPQIEGDRS